MLPCRPVASAANPAAPSVVPAPAPFAKPNLSLNLSMVKQQQQDGQSQLVTAGSSALDDGCVAVGVVEGGRESVIADAKIQCALTGTGTRARACVRARTRHNKLSACCCSHRATTPPVPKLDLGSILQQRVDEQANEPVYVEAPDGASGPGGRDAAAVEETREVRQAVPSAAAKGRSLGASEPGLARRCCVTMLHMLHCSHRAPNAVYGGVPPTDASSLPGPAPALQHYYIYPKLNQEVRSNMGVGGGFASASRDVAANCKGPAYCLCVCVCGGGDLRSSCERPALHNKLHLGIGAAWL